MDTKKTLVFFLVIASLLLLSGMATVNAATKDNLADITDVKVNGMVADSSNENPISVIAGETAFIEVYFTSDVDASDVRLEAEIEGEKIDVDAKTSRFDVENGKKYVKVLKLDIPQELKDEVSNDLELDIEIWNDDYKTETDQFILRAQRSSYDAAVMSIETDTAVNAGETIPVEVNLKNIGYNYIDDLYLTLKIPALEIEKEVYIGDVSELECEDDCNEEDTVAEKLYLEIPNDAESGDYTIEAEASNDDFSINDGKQISVTNEHPDRILVGSSRKSVKAGETAHYELLLINPTDSLKTYELVEESSSDVSVDLGSSLIAVPAGTTKTVTLEAEAQESGEYDFNVDVFSGSNLVESSELTLDVSEEDVMDPVFALTIVLAIIFVVLLVILIVLLGKKPQKEEDFGESYY